MSSHEGKRLIFVAYITTKSGRRLYASQYGKTAWAIWVTEKKP